MKYNIPCVKRIDETSCASADYTMVANGLGLPVKLADILQVTKSEIGFPPFWHWLVSEHNAEIVDFTENKLALWAEKGFDSFAKVTDSRVVKFLSDRMADPSSYQADLKFLLGSGHFQLRQEGPSVKLLKKYFAKDYVCDVMLDPWKIYGLKPERYSLHRVFIVDITGDEIVFHDPDTGGDEFYKSNSANFAKAFQIAGAELTCYKLPKSN